MTDTPDTAAASEHPCPECVTLRAYADKLAAGLPDGMLPQDVEVLRDANARFAAQAETAHQYVEALRRYHKEASAVLTGELGRDWGDHYGPLCECDMDVEDALAAYDKEQQA